MSAMTKRDADSMTYQDCIDRIILIDGIDRRIFVALLSKAFLLVRVVCLEQRGQSRIREQGNVSSNMIQLVVRCKIKMSITNEDDEQRTHIHKCS